MDYEQECFRLQGENAEIVTENNRLNDKIKDLIGRLNTLKAIIVVIIFALVATVFVMWLTYNRKIDQEYIKAYDKGYKEGLIDGYDEAYNEGYEDGLDDDD